MDGKVYSIGGCLSEEFSTTEVRFINILEADLEKSFFNTEVLFINILKAALENSLNYRGKIYTNIGGCLCEEFSTTEV